MDNCLIPQKSTILSVMPQTDIEWLFRVATPIKAQCGQFLQVSIPRVGEAPISVAGFSHDEGWIEFLIRRVGLVTNEIFNLKEGDHFFLRGTYGNTFPLEQFRDKEMLIIAGGSGLAPVRPLIRELVSRQPEKINLIMGFKDREAILFADDIAAWQKTGANIIVTVDKCENPVDGICVGLVTQYIEQILKDRNPASLQVVVVGPPMMMHFTTLDLLKNNIAEEQIWVSFERNMSCAVGKCGHCKIDETYICLDGPVFNYTKAKTLID